MHAIAPRRLPISQAQIGDERDDGADRNGDQARVDRRMRERGAGDPASRGYPIACHEHGYDDENDDGGGRKSSRSASRTTRWHIESQPSAQSRSSARLRRRGSRPRFGGQPGHHGRLEIGRGVRVGMGVERGLHLHQPLTVAALAQLSLGSLASRILDRHVYQPIQELEGALVTRLHDAVVIEALSQHTAALTTPGV